MTEYTSSSKTGSLDAGETVQYRWSTGKNTVSAPSRFPESPFYLFYVSAPSFSVLGFYLLVTGTSFKDCLWAICKDSKTCPDDSNVGGMKPQSSCPEAEQRLR